MTHLPAAERRGLSALRRVKEGSAVVMVLWLAVAVLVPVQASCQGVPMLINYQARLTDHSGNPLTGRHALSFGIHDSATSPVFLWQESYDLAEIEVVDGLVQVLLGSKTALSMNLFAQPVLYLGLRIDNDTELFPRRRIVSSPYAINSAYLDGKQPDDFEPAGSIADHRVEADPHPNLTIDTSRITGVLDESQISAEIARLVALQAHLNDQGNPHKVDLTQAASETQHDDLQGTGTYGHSAIDAHLDSQLNPHAVRADILDCTSGLADAGSFCIETEERTAADWFAAARACRQAGLRLCSPAEWHSACAQAAALGLQDMTDNREWVDNWMSINISTTNQFRAMTLGRNSCDEVDARDPSSPVAFRCCQ